MAVEAAKSLRFRDGPSARAELKRAACDVQVKYLIEQCPNSIFVFPLVYDPTPPL